jgi:predicted PhzF superfamily epimerase YddE/YHI9
MASFTTNLVCKRRRYIGPCARVVAGIHAGQLARALSLDFNTTVAQFLSAIDTRQDQLSAVREEAEAQLGQRRAELPSSREIQGYVADFGEFLREGTIQERKALIRNFVKGIEIVEDEAALTYTIPMLSDRVASESASVLDFVHSGPPKCT